MTFKIIQGDLFDPAHNFTAIAQGVNCQGVMGAGIAKEFRERYPEMYIEYKALCAGSKHLLPGTVHTYLMDGTDDRPDVFNLFTQFLPGRNGRFDYVDQALHNMVREIALLQSVFRHVFGRSEPFRVGLPWIGCGIAGLDKHNVEHFMRLHLTDPEDEFVLVEQPAV